MQQTPGRRVPLGQALDRLAQGQELVRCDRREEIQVIEVDASPVAAPSLPPLAPGPLDRDAAHRLSGRAEEMAESIPALGCVCIHQSEVRLVDQGRCLERLAGLLQGDLPRSQPAKLVVDQRQKLFGGLQVALLDPPEDLSAIVHRRSCR
jgi:hypothetical protein